MREPNYDKVRLRNRAEILPGPLPVFQDLSTCHDWPVRNPIVYLSIKMKGKLKRTSGNSLTPLGAQNGDFGAASRILIEVKLRLRTRLVKSRQENLNVLSTAMSG